METTHSQSSRALEPDKQILRKKGERKKHLRHIVKDGDAALLLGGKCLCSQGRHLAWGRRMIIQICAQLAARQRAFWQSHRKYSDEVRTIRTAGEEEKTNSSKGPQA